MAPNRKQLLLRLDPSVHDALAKWAADELRSTNAQIEFLLRRSLASAGRLPKGLREPRRPGRPPDPGDPGDPGELAESGPERSPPTTVAASDSSGE